MYTTKPLLGAILASTLALTLVACGGGGDDDGGSTSYTVTTSAGQGGSISPEQRTVNAGESTSFTIDPLTGYQIAQVSGCNGQLSGGTYNIAEVNADCQVTASFETRTLELTTEFDFGDHQVSADNMPTISPESVTVDYNKEQTFELTMPGPGWTLNSSSGCKIDTATEQNNINFTLTTAPILKDCNLVLTITPPGSSAGYEISADIVNGRAKLDGNYRSTDAFSYGEKVTVNLEAFGEGRELVRFQPSSASCDFERDGNSVTITVFDNCHFSALFLAADEHSFASNHMVRAFRNALSIEPEEHMTAAMVASVESVDLLNSPAVVLDLDGIQAALDLTSLSFRTLAADLAPLATLPLTTLKVEKIQYSGPADLEPLKAMPLQHLELTFFEASQSDYESALSPLSELRTLNLSNSRGLERIDFMHTYSHLTTLNLSNTGVLDIRPALDSGLVHRPEASFSVSGCASLEQPVTQNAKNNLEGFGVHTNIGSRSNWDMCPLPDDYYNNLGDLFNATLNADQLSVDWMLFDNHGDVSCELHYNLHKQQPRIADAEIPTCGTIGNETMTVDFDVQTVDMYLNDGLFPDPIKVGLTKEVVSTNDSTQLRLAAVEWGQTVFKTNPYLVPGRSAMLRAHVIADGEPTALPMTAELRLNGSPVANGNFTTPASIPAEPVYEDGGSGYQLIIPAQFMEEGLEIDFTLDGDLIYTAEPAFADPTTLSITIVPMVVNGVAPTIPSDEELAETIKTYWPVGEVEIERRSPVIVSDAGGDIAILDILYNLRDLHTQEGAQHYYHGFFDIEALNNKNASGVAFISGLVGVSWDSNLNTFAHELGHNFSLGHIDCGSPEQIEMNYPYPTDQMGSIFINYDHSQLYTPDLAKDLMSYCSPRLISDWVYEKAQDYLAINAPQPFTAAQAFDSTVLSQPTYSTYVSGVIDQVNGNSRVLSHSELSQPAGRENYGPFVMIATDSNGQTFERNFAIEQTSENDSQTNGYFNVRLPAYDIRDVQVLYQGKEVLRVQL
ncbi:hypothetical protein CWE12_08670 [Aliidiomarina sedimenti]|uniref:Bacterial repeat domain-containing protein n=1 Tax=Aliidiomarina sedimenti TaxID=1933879 RepID=A0ABY0BZ85_9GAMM|nr:hypothetical protein [Aliidiomarina sedimenti]RUO30023.1 hypothetical protein CWE12_08670 [Aliidiomarina sedimenti]